MRIRGRGERNRLWPALVGLVVLGGCSTVPMAVPVVAEPPAAESAFAAARPDEPAEDRLPFPPVPAAVETGPPLPINLPTALKLAGSTPLDIAMASERLERAAARLDQAEALWLPTINLGVDYFRHDGRIQDVGGVVFTTSKSSVLVGAGPTAVFGVTDAIYGPLAARQGVRARAADVQAARNDTTLAVAEAYFDVQQARGELAGSTEAVRRAEDLVRRTEQLAAGLVPGLEVSRVRTELARRRQAREVALERWQVASADLARVLRLRPGTLVEPAEAPQLRVDLIEPGLTPDDLIPVALAHRPELASQQAQVEAALARVRQEQMRPFVPVIAVRGVGSQVPGLSGGYFGGGLDGSLRNFGPRNSIDVQALWELRNLGLGNRALVQEREAESRLAGAEFLRAHDRVAAEVVQAVARVQRANSRTRAAEDEVRNAADTVEKNLQGLGQTQRVGDRVVLVFRPLEAVAAVAALDQAYRDYFTAVSDANRAQFALYRAVGHPPALPARPTAEPPGARLLAPSPPGELPAPVPVGGYFATPPG